MLVNFKCLRSGNIVSFKNEADIESMRKENGYQEVIENVMQKENETEAPKEKVNKRGRPKKLD